VAFRFVEQGTAEAAQGIATLLKPALEELAARQARWEGLAVYLPDGNTLDVLVCSEDAFAAERVLLPAFLNQAHQELAASMLAVVVPRRGVLMAIDARRPLPDLIHFAAIAADECARGPAAISPLVFAVEEGVLAGFLSGTDQVVAAPKPRPGAVEGAWIPIENVADGSIERIVIPIEPAVHQQIVELGLAAFSDALMGSSELQNFSGLFQIVVVPRSVKDDVDTRTELAILRGKARVLVEQMEITTASGGPIEVQATYSIDGAKKPPPIPEWLAFSAVVTFIGLGMMAMGGWAVVNVEEGAGADAAIGGGIVAIFGFIQVAVGAYSALFQTTPNVGYDPHL